MINFLGQDVLIEKGLNNQSIRLFVNGYGRITVLIGRRAIFNNDDILGFLQKHRRFVEKRLKQYSDAQLPDFSDGGKVYLLGKEYTVARNESIENFSIEGDRLYTPYIFSGLQAERFFGKMLYEYVSALTEHYAKTFGLKYSDISLLTRDSAWGSYHYTYHRIKYNIALVFLPERCVEYVVAHELCHSIHPNHSQAFWTEVEKVYPQYKQARECLHSYSISWLFERANIGILKRWKF